MLNKKRLNTYEAQKEEIEGILDSRIGANIKEFQIKAKSGQPSGTETPMDVDALTKGRSKGGKDPKLEKKSPAEGKGQKHDTQCYNCGKLGHKAAECWFKRVSSTATATKKEGKGQKEGKKGKAAGKIGKGYLGKTVGPKGFHSFGQEGGRSSSMSRARA